jgi:hypothetical protein
MICQLTDLIVSLQPGYQSPPGLIYDHTGTHTLLQSSHMVNGEALEPDTGWRFFPQRKPEPYLIRQGDVLLLTKGHRFEAAWVKKDPKYPTLASGLIMILRPQANKLTSPYLCWFLNLPQTQRLLAETSQGTSVRYLNRQSIAGLQIPLPPLARQEAFAQAYTKLRELRKLQNDLLDQYELQLQHLALTQETTP